jgi:HPt (histidine-containing phosphotransfer) domain-containing protein
LNTILKRWIPRIKQQDGITKDATLAALREENTYIKVDGLDVNKGIFLSGGSMESYLDTLGVFYKDGLEKILEINGSLEKGDIPLYTIFVHALKSACANIGADKLSAAARELEMAGERRDLIFIEENTSPFLVSFESMLHSINHVVKKYREAQKDTTESLNVEAINSDLVKLKTALETLDASTINTTIDNLKKLAGTGDIGDAIESLSENILMAEYDKAIEIIESLVSV